MTDPGPLEEERDLLLRSLDDLDDEYAAGDLDADDYHALRDSYTARAADVLRQLDGGPDSAGETASERTAPDARSAAKKSAVSEEVRADGRPGRRLLTLGALAAFAVIVGVLLARSLGERGVNDQLTGSIDESPRNKLVRCQELGSTGGDLVGALECFDEVLLVDPENAEALTYRGWYLLLAGGSLQQTPDASDADAATAAELTASGLDYLDRAIEADPLFPDPLAFRASVNDRLGRSDLVCADLATLLALDPPPFFVEQTAGLVERNNCS